MHKFRIYAPADPNHTRIEIDGKEMEGVTSITLNVSKRRQEMTLTVRGEIEISGEFEQIDMLKGATRSEDQPEAHRYEKSHR